MSFVAVDYLVLVAYLLATALFGAWVGRRQRNLKQYFLGGRNLPWWTICFSIVATETSTLTFIGAPAIAYQGNLTFLQIAIGYVVGRLLVSLFLIPAYFKGEIQTAYELLQSRFGDRVRDLSSLLFQVNRTLADGVRLAATALVLSVATQITDVWTIAVIGLITIAYTFYGGIVAVVWNDVVQMMIYLGGAILTGYVILSKIPGGWPAAVAQASSESKFTLINLSWDWSEPYTLLGGVVGGAFLTFATHGTDQMMVQRYLACRSRWQSQLALMASSLVVLLQFGLFLLIGVLLYVYYQIFPLERELTQINQILPIFIVEELPAGLSGLIIAASFAAAMSTLSSSLNSLASSSLNDYYRRYWRPQADDNHYLWVSRLFTVAWGFILIWVSLLARNWGEVLQVGLTITSVTMGSVLGIFLLGQWTKRPSQASGLAGMAAGLVSVLAIHLSGALAWTWYVLVGAGVTFVVGVLLSLVGSATNRACE